MVDTKEAMESSFVSVDIVNTSPSKKCVVVDPGSYELDDYKNRRLTVGVNIDGKLKKWRPNKKSVENLQVLGADSTAWVGKVISLQVERGKSMDMVIGSPEQAPAPTPAAKVPGAEPQPPQPAA